MNWERTRLKYVTSFAYGDALPADNSGDGKILVFGSNGPFTRFHETNTKAPVIIIGRKGSYGKINWSLESCFASDTTFYIDESTTKNNLRWLYYVLQTLELDRGSGETAIPGLSRDDAYGKSVLVPPISDQQAIANYLDSETTHIDALITTKEKLLELLAEKRRVLITNAITLGLNPNVMLKNSCVEWLGKIPSHWGVERSKWLFRERDERIDNEEGELLTVSHITGVTPRSEKDVNMFEAETTEGYKICCKGDLAINTMWAWMGAMGISPIDGIVSPGYNVYILGERLIGSYVDNLVRTKQFSIEVVRHSKGVWSSRLRLYPEGLFEIYFPVPPIEEQKEIVNHINKETAKIDSLIKVTEKSIELLKKRRSVLISDVVTGKIKVS